MRIKVRTQTILTLLFLVAMVLPSACGTNRLPASPPKDTAPTSTTTVASPSTPTPSASAEPAPTQPAAPTATATRQPLPTFAYTYIRPDGNRYIAGTGPLPDSRRLDIVLTGTPVWLVAAPYRDGSIWVAVLESGQTQAFYVTDGEFREVAITPAQLEPGMPPLLRVADDEASLITLASPRQSALTHPVPLDEDTLAYIDVDGDLVITGERELGRLALNALPDARILQDDAGRLLLLSGATDGYTHGVLGDELEATEITLVEPLPEPRIVQTITLTSSQVIEGIAPIWADSTGDGSRDIIVTVSDANQGARLVTFSETGERIAEGPAIGQGFRWRHQIAVAPFPPDGERELADVLTPHIGGTVEFFRFDRGKLDTVATVGGYASHVIGSRNLDMAAAADIDGDGTVELLVPNQARTEYGAMRRTQDGAEVVHRLALQGTLHTNLAAVTFPDGRIGIGVGLEDARLRLWLPASQS